MALVYPEELQYFNSHEYIKVDEDVATIGISAFAVDQLGDIVYLDLPIVGTNVTKGEPFGTVESVKAVEDIYAPVSGIVVERNEPIVENPEFIAEDPYYKGWLIRVRLGQDSPEAGMSATEYRALVES